MGFREYCNGKITEYELLLASYKRQITDDRPPRLRLYQGKRGATFSKIIYSRKDRRRHSVRIPTEEALRIQKNHFCLRMVKILTKDLKLLKKCMKNFLEPDPAVVMAGMPQAYRFQGSFLPPMATREAEEMKKAQRSPAGAGGGHSLRDEAPRILTADGTMVKSRIEALIYNALLVSGLEFQYECPLTLSGITFRPDFTIWLPNGRIFYWEHLGLLGKNGYRSEQQVKLKTYYENNITIGIDLILTADSIDKSVETQIIDETILGLKRLGGLAA